MKRVIEHIIDMEILRALFYVVPRKNDSHLDPHNTNMTLIGRITGSSVRIQGLTLLTESCGRLVNGNTGAGNCRLI